MQTIILNCLWEKNETFKEHLERLLFELENKIKKNNPETICAFVGVGLN